MLLSALMATREAHQSVSWVFVAVIVIAVLIDAILLAQVHVNFLRDHGYDVLPQRPAVTRPVTP
jgi:hypothetical protein